MTTKKRKQNYLFLSYCQYIRQRVQNQKPSQILEQEQLGRHVRVKLARVLTLIIHTKTQVQAQIECMGQRLASLNLSQLGDSSKSFVLSIWVLIIVRESEWKPVTRKQGSQIQSNRIEGISLSITSGHYNNHYMVPRCRTHQFSILVLTWWCYTLEQV